MVSDGSDPIQNHIGPLPKAFKSIFYMIVWLSWVYNPCLSQQLVNWEYCVSGSAHMQVESMQIHCHNWFLFERICLYLSPALAWVPQKRGWESCVCVQAGGAGEMLWTGQRNTIEISYWRQVMRTNRLPGKNQ